MDASSSQLKNTCLEHSQPSSERDQEIHRLFTLPDHPSTPYRDSIASILHSLHGMDTFTTSLEAKVDHLLQLHQTEFVTAYTAHMNKVRHEFKALSDQVAQQNDLILYYENEGKMSDLVKKVTMLEGQSKRLYGAIDVRDRELKLYKLELKVQKEENKRMNGQLKQIMKARANGTTTNTNNTNDINTNTNIDDENIADNNPITIANSNMHPNLIADNSNMHPNLIADNSIQPNLIADNSMQPNLITDNSMHPKFFTTEIQGERSLKRDLSATTQDNKPIRSFTYNLSDQSILHLEDNRQRERENKEKNKMKKKLQELTMRNKELSHISGKVLSSRNELEDLFVDAVAEIKKNIRMRRKIRECSYEDFKKEDKLNLLVIIISNEEILKVVYERLFVYNKKGETNSKETSQGEGMKTGQYREGMNKKLHSHHYINHMEQNEESVAVVKSEKKSRENTNKSRDNTKRESENRSNRVGNNKNKTVVISSKVVNNMGISNINYPQHSSIMLPQIQTHK